jgi:class 3 adenylate cyclase
LRSPATSASCRCCRPAPSRRVPTFASAIEEREVVALQVTWRNRAVFARSHLPQDVVYLSRLFVETVGGALDASGGIVGETNVDGVTAVLRSPGPPTRRARRRSRRPPRSTPRSTDCRRRYASLFGAAAISP